MFSPDDTLQKLPTSPPIAHCPEGGDTAQLSCKGAGDRFPAKSQELSKAQVLSNKQKSLSPSCKTCCLFLNDLQFTHFLECPYFSFT